MKRRCVKKCTMHDSMPWSDESWYYDDDFYSDGYHEDMPAFLSKAGSAIASKAKSAKNALMGGIQKAGNRIEKASNKVEGAIGRGASKVGGAVKGAASKVKGLFSRKPKTLAERGKDMLNSAKKTISKKANAIKKTVSKKAKAAGNWAKKNPVKAAAATGAGIGAGVAAHQAVSGMTGRDSMFGITSYDSLPWVNGRRRDSALKRYIDKRVKQIISRLNDLEPGEFDPSIPLYNNRLPKPAETNVTRAPGGPVSTTLAEITTSINEIRGAISFLTKNGIPLRMKDIFDRACPEMITLARDGSSVMLRRALKINDLLMKYINDIKSRFLFDNGSHRSMYRGDPLQAKQLLNKCTEKLKKLESLLTAFSFR